MDLIDYTESVFARNGALGKVLPGYVRSGNQRDYALRVAETLEGSGENDRMRMALLEAETGTGKTLGYLVPLAGYAAMTGNRVAVSTYTTHLQRQLNPAKGDLRTAVEAADSMLGTSLRAAHRFGLRNYLSPGRMAYLLASEDAKSLPKEVIDRLQYMLQSIQAGGSALLMDWTFDDGRLPEGFPLDLVLCEYWEKDRPINHAGYLAQAESARNADIIVVNHATLLLNGVQGFRLLGGERDITAVVVDEADRIPDAASSISQKTLSLSRARELLLRIRDGAQGNNVLLQDIQAAESIIEDHWTILEGLRSGRGTPLPLALTRNGSRGGLTLEEMSIASDAALAVAGAMDLVLASAKTIGIEAVCGGEDDARRVEDAVTKIRSLAKRYHSVITSPSLKVNAGFAPGVSWSPRLLHPSLNLIQLKPGHKLMKYWLHETGETVDTETRPRGSVQAMVITSATLGDNGDESGVIRSMGDLGVFRKHLDPIVECFTQSHFGTMSFVRSDAKSGAPKPTITDDDDESITNPAWLDYAASMIRRAAKSDRRVLALALSHNDTAELALRLSDLGDRLIVHSPGAKLNTLLPGFKEARNAVLLSPSCWEGLDLPGMIGELVITRIPILPPEAPLIEAFGVSLRSEKNGEAAIRRMQWKVMQSIARKRLRQGLGRGIRQHSDSVRVWIGDYRFSGVKNDDWHGGTDYLHSIPARFRAAWKEAEVFVPDGRKPAARRSPEREVRCSPTP